MRYLGIALPDLQREYQPARSQPRHLVPPPVFNTVRPSVVARWFKSCALELRTQAVIGRSAADIW